MKIDLPMARLVATGRVTHAAAPGEFPGATLRGAFGRELRSSVCVTRAQTCDGCGLRAACTYGRVFDPAPPDPIAGLSHGANTRTPPAYVLDIRQLPARPRPGDTCELRLTLVGPALQHRRVIEQALRASLMPGRNPFLQMQMVDCQLEPFAPIAEAAPDIGLVHLAFTTPLRIQRGGQPLRSAGQLEARDILMAAVKRVGSLLELVVGTRDHGIDYAGLSAAARLVRLTQPDLHWIEARRFSARQGRSIPLGGLIGEFWLTGPLGPFAPFLSACEWLHIGKEAAFGLGAYRLTVSASLPHSLSLR